MRLVSKNEKKITEIIRKSEFPQMDQSDIYRIAGYFNPKIASWIDHFGKFRKHELQWIFNVFHRRLNQVGG